MTARGDRWISKRHNGSQGTDSGGDYKITNFQNVPIQLDAVVKANLPEFAAITLLTNLSTASILFLGSFLHVKRVNLIARQALPENGPASEITAALCLLAYVISADSCDKYLSTGGSIIWESLAFLQRVYAAIWASLIEAVHMALDTNVSRPFGFPPFYAAKAYMAYYTYATTVINNGSTLHSTLTITNGTPTLWLGTATIRTANATLGQHPPPRIRAAFKQRINTANPSIIANKDESTITHK
ncbi:hypothetical protein K470DRAFT_288232 [Piedraia hortae CBS 480.64]|uniref:Uncharacterized protein n=1 Tax=Piedraia hortae CBS 480.64 TaxID=1314780 RepID=A0A6A7C8C8_9PEZI|nr:hypothetical protein K470DRAFT_288232 [Piedraia hortae CBS 480.64]